MGGVAVLIARLSLKVKVEPVALVICLSLQHEFIFFLLNQKVVIIKQNLRDTKQPQFVFVLIGVETKQPIVICLSDPK